MNWKTSTIELPEAIHTNLYMSWSDPVEFEHETLGRLRGVYFSNSGGFFRAKGSGFDFSWKEVVRWRCAGVGKERKKSKAKNSVKIEFLKRKES